MIPFDRNRYTQNIDSSSVKLSAIVFFFAFLQSPGTRCDSVIYYKILNILLLKKQNKIPTCNTNLISPLLCIQAYLLYYSHYIRLLLHFTKYSQ